MQLTATLAFLAAAAAAATALSLPDYIKPCRSKDKGELSRCALERANEILPRLIPGDRKYGLPPLDPIHVDQVDINAGSFHLSFKNMSLEGHRKAHVNNVTIDPQARHINFRYELPMLTIHSFYTISGRIVALPVGGNGDCVITYDKFEGDYSCDYELEKKKDGEQHIKLTKPHFKLTTTRMVHQLNNLFNGDELLGRTTNNFINDNWQDMLHEMGPVVEEAFSKVITRVIQGFSDAVPFKEMFPQ